MVPCGLHFACGTRDGKANEEADRKAEADKEETKDKKEPGFTLKSFVNTVFADILLKGDIAVIKSSYFEYCLKNDELIVDRANIPEEFFIKGEELMNLWETYDPRMCGPRGSRWEFGDHLQG